MIRLFCFMLVAMLGCQQALAIERSPPQRFVVILDCSQDMRTAMVGARENGVQQVTRLDVASQAVKGWLAQLAIRQKHAVSLVMSDNEAMDVLGEAALQSQDLLKYVDALDGPAAASEALPLEAVERAVELSERGSRAAIMLLTSNEAPSEQCQACIERLEAAAAPIHIVAIGKNRRRLEAYGELAKTSGGSLYQATDERQALAALCTAAGLISANRVLRSEIPTPVSALQDETLEPQPAGDDDMEGITSTPKADELRIPTADIVIDVTYYNQGVKDAKVYLRGEHFDLVYDRAKETPKHWYSRVGGTYVDSKPLPQGTLGAGPATEPGGGYIFEGVPFGKYKMEVFAVVKNRAYVYEREFIVDLPNKEFKPYADYNRYRFKVLLEKTK